MRWGVVLVAVCVVVDVVVLGTSYALGNRSVTTAPASAVATASATGSGASSARSASPSATSSTATGGATADNWRGPIFLETGASGRLVRVTRGSCDDRTPRAPRVWVADRFKAPLQEVRVPDLQEALGVSVGGGAITIVGADARCRTSAFVSRDAGASWQRRPVPDDVWYLDTDTSATVLRGPVKGGRLTMDCPPVSVTTLDGGARALVSCGFGNVELVDRDQSTRDPQTYLVTSPVAAARVGTRTDVALGADQSCPAALLTLDLQRSAVGGTCFGDTGAPLGVAASGDRVFVQVGYRLMVSDDGGKSFRRYPAS